MNRRQALLGAAALLSDRALMPLPAFAQSPAGAEARAIAKEATIYGFPLVDNYRIQHSYFVDRGGPEFKAPWNTLVNNARVYTPDDKAIQTPNSDTPYSYVGADLRAEPLVFTVPAVEKGRYYSLQFIDMYTFNFAYVGSRATGNGAGSYLLAGPRWKGTTPKGIKAVIRSETDFAFVLYRTQLFNPADIENVKKIQAGYKVRAALGVSRPAGARRPRPPSTSSSRSRAEQERTSPAILQRPEFHSAVLPDRSFREGADGALRQDRHRRAASRFDANALSPEMRKALEDGMADAWAAFKEYKETQLDTGKKTSADGFGTRASLKNDYMDRMAGAVLGIYGNSKDEAIYPVYFVDCRQAKARWRQPLHAALCAGPVAAGQRVLVADDVRAAGEPALRQSAQPLSDQFADAAEPEARRRWRDHALCPERVAGRGQGIELAARAEGAVLHGAAAVLAEARRAQRQMEGAAAAADELNTRGERR